MSLNEPIRYLFTLKSVFSTKIHRSVYLVLRGLWWVMASFDRRLYTDLQDIRASLYTALVPVDSGALLLALNVIVCWEWRGECLMKRIIAGSRVHTCLSPGAQWACLRDGHQPPGGWPMLRVLFTNVTHFPLGSDWAAATKTTRPNYSIFSNSSSVFPGSGWFSCVAIIGGKTEGPEMMRQIIFEYFLLINEASYLFCDSLSYIFQQLNNSLEMLRLPQCSVSILLEFDLTILNFSFISAMANVIGEPGPFDGLIICCGGVKPLCKTSHKSP